MNIAIGKIGRSSYFDKNNWSIYAGDDSPYIIYTTLAKAFPQHNFYMIGGNDLDRIKGSCRKFKRIFWKNFFDFKTFARNKKVF